MSSSLLAVSPSENRGALARQLTFGVGSIGTGVFSVIPSVLLLYYLTTAVHVQPAFAGLIIMTPKVVSILTDPFVGHFSDRLKAKSEWHRRAFMLVGAICAGLGLWAVFTLPAIMPNGGWLAAVLYFISVVGFSFFAVPYNALPADIEPLAAGRTKLVTTRMSFAFIGGLSASVAAPIIVSTIGYPAMGASVGLLCFVAVVVCVTTYSRRPGGAVTTSHPEKLSLAGLANKTFLRVLLGFMLLCIAWATVNAAMPFLVEGLFKRPGADLSEALLISGVGGLVTTVLWPLLLRRIGPTNAWRLCAGLMILGYGLMSVAGTPNWSYMLGLVVGGVAYAGCQVTGFVSLADSATKSEAAGRSGSGMMTGLWLAGEKVAYALGPLVVGLVMQLFAVPGGSMRTALLIAIGIIPGLLAATAVVAVSRHGELMA